ncbi:formyltetrahydrofolate deformylase [Sphingomonas corticis]|jgi:formyltetrahydrofolate deformylase|uniref:Formyltetrahydrofolate deformylase n=1 Tax=Sphingomonas corticis TaxID=2722791 RepID=A0ABX1CKD8_9SPHN|nr:formyltetrahydrofolate deformylase [Sphingomonas corticis]NJR78439.1 formyltetrahydrofolate deformylase [Sphingomonas corticis]
MHRRFVLTVTCPDRIGIVAVTAGFLATHRCSITEAHQHHEGDGFFMRLAFRAEDAAITAAALEAAFAPVAREFAMTARVHDAARRPRVLILVSRFGHCLFDLLHRWRNGQLAVDVVGVLSNHDDMRSFVEWNGLPFHHLPVTAETKATQEAAILRLVEDGQADLVVLARYMQILSPALCAALAGRCINIHHSFLPSFKGAKPYHQAHRRGVKIIGATAHYVTTDLDEGPIIEQDVRRVNHARSADDLVTLGQEVECAVLARAVQWHVDHRVLLNGQQTIVFD